MSERVERLLAEYQERFDDAFPTFAFTRDDDVIAEAVEACLVRGEPIELDEGVIY